MRMVLCSVVIGLVLAGCIDEPDPWTGKDIVDVTADVGRRDGIRRGDGRLGDQLGNADIKDTSAPDVHDTMSETVLVDLPVEIKVADVVDAADLPMFDHVDDAVPDVVDLMPGDDVDTSDICEPQCEGKECGSDGCGGSCGECSMAYSCLGNACTCAGVELPKLLWSKTYGSDGAERANDVVVLPAGGLAVAAVVDDSNGGDAWLIRTDVDGSVLWDKTLGGGNLDYAWALEVLSDSSFILAGKTVLAPEDDAGWVVKTDDAGEVVWEKAFGGQGIDAFAALCPLGDGVLLAGLSASSNEDGEWDGWLCMVDGQGDLLWEQTYGGGQKENILDVVELGEEGFAFLGWTASTENEKGDFWLTMTDKAGNLTWQKTYGEANNETAYSLGVVPDSGFAIAGARQSEDQTTSEAWVVRTDKLGEIVWDKTFPGYDTGSARSLVVMPDGGLTVAGRERSPETGKLDAWLLRMNAEGETVWETAIGGDHDDAAMSIRRLPDGSLVVAGWTKSFGASGQDAWLFKIVTECCSPDCEAKECGGDGCGGSCGECGDNEECNAGSCGCVQDSALCNDVCCPVGQVCFDGTCCTADCDGKECGDDGCGGICAECVDDNLCDGTPACQAGECVDGDPVDCDDDNPCTGDTCIPADGSCQHVNFADGVPCVESNLCNATCESGVCIDGTSEEVCDDIDNNCDGAKDPEDSAGCEPYFKDIDGDGWGTEDAKCLCGPKGLHTTLQTGDCEPLNSDVNPGAQDICNGIDDNCNGMTDVEDSLGCSLFFKDADSDGWGVEETKCLCAPAAPFTADQVGDCDDLEGSVHPGGVKCGKDGNCDGNLLDPGEECDDSNASAFDGCEQCKIAEFALDEGDGCTNSVPDVAANPAGGYAAVWLHSCWNPEQLKYITTVSCTVLGADGEVVVQPKQVNAGEHLPLTVVAAWLSDGNLAIVWNAEKASLDGSNGILGRIFTPLGIPLTEDFLVSVNVGVTHRPDIAALPTGNWVAVWDCETGCGSSSSEIFGQLLDGSGNPVGSEFQVNTLTYDHQHSARVAVLKNGGFVVVWETQDGPGTSARLFDGTGIPTTNNLYVTGNPSPSAQPDVVAVADGGFSAVWRTSKIIWVRRYNSGGTGPWNPVVANAMDLHQVGSVRATTVAAGELVAVWSDIVNEVQDVFVRRLAPDGTGISPEQQVNTHVDGDQANPSVDSLSDGGHVVVWQDKQIGRVVAQRFGADGNKLYK